MLNTGLPRHETMGIRDTNYLSGYNHTNVMIPVLLEERLRSEVQEREANICSDESINKFNESIC